MRFGVHAAVLLNSTIFCDVTLSERQFLTFQRIIEPSSSGSSNPSHVFGSFGPADEGTTSFWNVGCICLDSQGDP